VSDEDPAVGTLIFDEVDAGIGGAVAITVGRLMQRLGAARQVLAVTHLAQVAACADQHFVVSKGGEAASADSTATGSTTSASNTSDSTAGAAISSALRAVAGSDRVAELARMLGGAQHSQAGLAHARELLDDSTRAAGPATDLAARTASPRATRNSPASQDSATRPPVCNPDAPPPGAAA
jgi:DNA repair protein RecN (Recombination protein N)